MPNTQIIRETCCRTLLPLLLLPAVALPVLGQDEERIQKLFAAAIAEMGGDAYLNVTDSVSEGNYFVFDRDGDSSGLIKFNDYTKYPNKSRFELGNKKNTREVTVFNLETNEGWVLEGQKETREATPQEMKSYHDAVKHSLENILRIRYKDPRNKLFYLGPGTGSEVRLEQVQILDPENDTVTVYFDRMSRLPAKIEYKGLDSRGVPLRHVEEYYQWHEIQGAKIPLRIDHFVNGRKSSQLFVTKITLNNGLPDSFFSKPVPPK